MIKQIERDNCKSCQMIVDEYGVENLEVCEFCGHYYVQYKDDTGFCTCTKGEQKENFRKGIEIHNKLQKLSKYMKIDVSKKYTEQEIDKLLYTYMAKELSRAKEIIEAYLNQNIDDDVRILGADHPYEICGCNIGDVQKAFNLLKYNYNYFNGN